MVTIYALEGCPYCETVSDRLDEADVDYECEWVPALHSGRDEIKRISGQRAVPVLVDEDRGVTMAESKISSSTSTGRSPDDPTAVVSHSEMHLLALDTNNSIVAVESRRVQPYRAVIGRHYRFERRPNRFVASYYTDVTRPLPTVDGCYCLPTVRITMGHAPDESPAGIQGPPVCVRPRHHRAAKPIACVRARIARKWTRPASS